MGSSIVRLNRIAVVLMFGLLACATAPRASDYTDPTRLERLVSSQEVPYLLLDVRTPPEFHAGHIPTAINIPYDTIAERMPKVDTDSLVIVYCASGARAAIAVRTLAGMGFTNVGDFGTLSRWQGELATGG